MKVIAEFEFELDNNARIIYESLLPELQEDYQHTKTDLKLKNNILLLNVEAHDMVSLRAALNGWLRLIKICSEMCSITSNT